MKKLVVLSTLALASLCYAQQDVAVVVARTPRYVTVYQQQCGTQEVVRGNNGNGAIVGGLAGAALGSTIGHNHRDSLAGGVVGALVGGAIGNEVTKGPDTVEQRTVCRNVPVTMQQGETVTFQYQGRTFSQTFP
jgi:outer membrane lipoprotein SlyB